MKNTLVARRYAGALLMLAKEQNTAEATGTELNSFAALLDSSAELRKVLENPAIGRGDRLAVIGAFADKLGMSKTTGNFLRLMVEKGRGGALREAVTHYGELLDQELGRARAVVSSTKALDEGALAALKEKLEAVTGKSVILENKIDPSLLGGVVTRVGSLVFDGSVKGRLDTLRDRLIREAGA